MRSIWVYFVYRFLFSPLLDNEEDADEFDESQENVFGK